MTAGFEGSEKKISKSTTGLNPFWSITMINTRVLWDRIQTSESEKFRDSQLKSKLKPVPEIGNRLRMGEKYVYQAWWLNLNEIVRKTRFQLKYWIKTAYFKIQNQFKPVFWEKNIKHSTLRNQNRTIKPVLRKDPRNVGTSKIPPTNSNWFHDEGKHKFLPQNNKKLTSIWNRFRDKFHVADEAFPNHYNH